ncbi:restriction endonuclease subunit S [Pseudoalteromonas arctica]|uniref:Type I restriction enzyme, S subunit n=1 Tax=Pseudoalteromonas arctica A 37-1-2 TaxID=1117313 RepID=A0A290RXC3_9GAMM|nr:restriction endonuclease subunit S [Pseudoalteromonas arctica]ATC85054.1 type I restriction enzyme, S subunit [Pseudoalteromonas arctica A 37-1-2]
MSEFKIAFTEQVKNFETSIGKLLEIKSGKGFKASEYSTKGRPLLQIENVGYGTIKWKAPSFLPEEYSLSEAELVLERGDIVLALNRPITNGQLKISKITAMDEGAILYQRVGKVISKGLANYDYLYHLLSIQVKKFVESKSIGSDQPFISIRELYQYPVVLPVCKNEQQKIADFLTSVDTKISQLTEKHRLLKDYKKGVMQQIFSQQIRFKDDDGNAFPDWNEYSLRDILILQADALKMDDEATYELITVKRGFGGIKSRGHFKGKDVLVKSQFTIHKGEFVISKRQIVHGACGLVPEELDGAIVSNEYNVFRPQPTKLDIDYFNRLSTTLYMRRAFFINSDGVHIEKLLFKTQSWLKTKVQLPCLKEQQKIAQFLQSLDKKIDAVNEQIEQTKLFKKGLLQQMFV